LSRIVIVSNRVNLPSDRDGAGGLAVALREPAKRYGGIWFGWSGQIAETVNDRPRLATAGKVTYASTDLTRDEFEQYYLQYSNSTLWPLLHYRLGLVDYSRRAFEAYLRVSARWANLLRPLLRPDDLIWVNDFHLVPFAAALRRLGVANRIGFFLHTPFPCFDVLAVLPHHDCLLRDLCAYDLVGFQTADSLNAFFGSIAASSDARIYRDGAFTAWGFRSRAAHFPIGIDTEEFVKVAQTASGSPEALRLRESLADRRLVFGVDRLDYSKGIPQRFAAIDWLLTDRPEQRRRFSYLQVAPHSRAELPQYRALRRELESSAGRINGKFAEFDWSPIRYINRSFSRRTLAGFYRLARVGLVTPLRDGMNLVAKEFVAAQDPADPGVLILSRFAGAARELESALLVNPIDTEAMAEALYRALVMPLAERQDRWRCMISVLRNNTIISWSEAFISALSRPADALAPPPPVPIDVGVGEPASEPYTIRPQRRSRDSEALANASP
jgi:trehalose 6-phosphate synthase